MWDTMLCNTLDWQKNISIIFDIHCTVSDVVMWMDGCLDLCVKPITPTFFHFCTGGYLYFNRTCKLQL